MCDGTTAGEHGLYNGQIVCLTSESSDPLKSIDGRSQGVKLVRQPWAAGLANHLVPTFAFSTPHEHIFLENGSTQEYGCFQPYCVLGLLLMTVVYSRYTVIVAWLRDAKGFNTRCSMPEIANLLSVAWKLVQYTRTILPEEADWCGKSEDRCS